MLTFRRDGDAYSLQATGQPEVPIEPTCDSTFRITVVDASIELHVHNLPGKGCVFSVELERAASSVS